MGKRFWEIDFLRGTAIIMMILYHTLFDLVFFGYYEMVIYTGFWRYFAYTTSSMFILLSGISLTISYSRRKNFERHIYRGLKIFTLGMLATFVTWVFLGEGYIIFGILHFFGIAIIISYPFLRLRHMNFLFGILAIIAGLFLYNMVFDFPWLLWLGFIPKGFYTVDYFPLLPWFGVYLIGMSAGTRFYPKAKRGFRFPDLSKNFIVRKFCFLGRHSLIIYLLHQIIIIMVLALIAHFV